MCISNIRHEAEVIEIGATPNYERRFTFGNAIVDRWDELFITDAKESRWPECTGQEIALWVVGSKDDVFSKSLRIPSLAISSDAKIVSISNTHLGSTINKLGSSKRHLLCHVWIIMVGIICYHGDT